MALDLDELRNNLPNHRRHNKITLTCPACAQEFIVPYKERDRKYCSHKCRASVYLTQEHNKRVARATAQQRGDALRGGGEGKTYIKEGGRHQHVVVAERKLGRKLRHGEVVHHIDDNKRNNDPSNIEVKASQAEHAREHLAERRTRKAQTAVDLLFNNLER